MVYGLHGSYRGAQTGQHFRRYVRTSSLRNVCAYRNGGISMLVYTTAACLPHAPRLGNVGEGLRLHRLPLEWKPSCSPNGPVPQAIRACLVHRPYMSVFPDGVPPKINCHLRACARGKHVSPEVPTRLCSTIPFKSPRPCQRTHLLTLPGRSACGKHAAVVYTSSDTTASVSRLV